MRPNYRYSMSALYAELSRCAEVGTMVQDIFLFQLITEQWFWWGEIWENAAVSKARKTQLLQECLPGVFSPLFANFLQMIADNEDTIWYAHIIESFLAEVKLKEDCEFVGVDTPTILSSSNMQAIGNKLSKRFGKKVYIYQKIEPQLLDGFRLSFQGNMIDLSGRHVLDDMEEVLVR